MNRTSVGFSTLFLLFITTFPSCELLDTKPVVVPAYVCVDSIRLVSNPNISGYQGDISHKIVDVWISQNGISLGDIGLPSLIPVQISGPTQITVEPGILKSGQDDIRVIYPFIEPIISKIDLKPGKIDTIRPVFKYFDATEFPFIEDFERSFFGFTYNPYYHDSADVIVKVTDPRTPQDSTKHSGKLIIGDASTVFQIYTPDMKTLPQYGAPVYWEMDYMSNLPLEFGYYYSENQGVDYSGANSVVLLNATNGWNKVYISLAEEIAGKKAGVWFRFYIGLHKSAGSHCELLLDNMKLVNLP